MEPIQTLVPNQPAIELIAYYPKFLEYYRECELQTKRWFVEHVEPDWVMFDAGANIGYYSILFSRLASRGTVYAFEPTETIDMLKANLSHNGCTNVVPLGIALGRSSGMREDNVFKIWGDEPERKMFEFATVDDMLLRLDVHRLDCIKIDVDSFDYEVLRGSEDTLRQLNPWIVVELNDALFRRNQSARQAFEWLYSLGYRDAHVTDDENHIFKRNGSLPQSRSAFPSFNLSFDTQPVIIAPRWVKGDLIEGAFERDPRKHNSAAVLSETGGAGTKSWFVTVPSPRWSYAASWLRSERELTDNPIIIEVDLSVMGGAVGVGCIKSDETGYLDEEAQVEPLPARQTISILIEHPREIGYVVLRNSDANKMTAEVRVRSICAYLAVASSTTHADGLLSATKQRISLAECSAALAGMQPSAISATSSEDGIDIVPVAQLGQALNFPNVFVPEIRVYRHGLVDFKSGIDDSAMLAYLYRESNSKRHLEFGTGEGSGTLLCASSSSAEIWTVDVSSNGSPTSPIGWRYRASTHVSRIHQIVSHDHSLDEELFGEDAFDTVMINSGKSAEEAGRNTTAALQMLRPGGLLICHGFCPDVETLLHNEVARNFVTAVVQNYPAWLPRLSTCFWIRPSWILVGIKD